LLVRRTAEGRHHPVKDGVSLVDAGNLAAPSDAAELPKFKGNTCPTPVGLVAGAVRSKGVAGVKRVLICQLRWHLPHRVGGVHLLTILVGFPSLMPLLKFLQEVKGGGSRRACASVSLLTASGSSRPAMRDTDFLADMVMFLSLLLQTSTLLALSLRTLVSDSRYERAKTVGGW